VPITVLTATVVAAVVARKTQRPIPPPGTNDTILPSAVLEKGVSETPFDMPLRAPAPPASVEVPPGAARMIHGSARHVHRAAARGPRAPNVGFRVSVGGPVAAQVTASPDEKTLYVATLGGQLVALDRADGSRRWAVNLGDRAYATPLVPDDGTIYVGSDAKKMMAFSPAGQPLFRVDVEGEADTGAVIASNGNIVFAAGNHVYAMRRRGDLAWRFSAKGKVFTSPAVRDDGLIVFGSQDHKVYALDAAGKLAWSADLGADVDGAPAIADDGAIYVGTDAAEVVRLDGEGRVVWRTNVRGFVRGTLSIARNGDVLAGTYGPVPRIVRLAPDGTVLGAFAIFGTGAREFGIHGGPLEDADGVLYFGGQDDAVHAVGPDGLERWRFDTGGDVDAPITMLSDGSLVVASEAGTVTLLLP
jgi:outer membrane protein assembly factor BamB